MREGVRLEVEEGVVQVTLKVEAEAVVVGLEAGKEVGKGEEMAEAVDSALEMVETEATSKVVAGMDLVELELAVVEAEKEGEGVHLEICRTPEE